MQMPLLSPRPPRVRALAQCVGEEERETEGERLRVGVPVLLREPVKEPVRLRPRESVALGEREGEGVALRVPVGEGVGLALGEGEAGGQVGGALSCA